MPNKSSAKKALRQSIKKRSRNRIRKNAFKKLSKKARFLASQNKKEEAKKLLPSLYKALDKAAKSGIIHKNNASRKKSRLTKIVS